MIPDAAIEAAAEAIAKKDGRLDTWATDAWIARAAIEAAWPFLCDTPLRGSVTHRG